MCLQPLLASRTGTLHGTCTPPKYINKTWILGWELVEAYFHDIDDSLINSLVKSFRHRIDAFIEQKGAQNTF